MPQPQITYTTPKVDRHGDHTHIEFEVVSDAGIGKEIITLARAAGLGGAIIIRDTLTRQLGFLAIPDPVLPAVLAEIHHLRGEIETAPGGCELAAAGCPCGCVVDHSGAGK